MAALGAETPSGDFNVVEFLFAGLPPQPQRVVPTSAEEWVAIVSGLEMGAGSSEQDVHATLLTEWLLGEVGGDTVSISWLFEDEHSSLTVAISP